jgi:hypothetical protein
MNVELSKVIPSEDGYYLMKFNNTGGLYLVLIQTQLNKVRVIIPQSHSPKQLLIQINDNHGPLLSDAYFSVEPLKITLI